MNDELVGELFRLTIGISFFPVRAVHEIRLERNDILLFLRRRTAKSKSKWVVCLSSRGPVEILEERFLDVAAPLDDFWPELL